MQLLKRSTAVPDDADHPARRWFRRWSLWPPVLELPPWIRWVQASPAYPDHPIAGALIAAAAPLKPWINLTPSFPKHVLAGVHLVPIGPEGQSALDGDPDDRQRRRFGARSYGDLSDAVVVIGKLATAGASWSARGWPMGWRSPAGAASPWSSRSVRRAGRRSQPRSPWAFRERHAGSLRSRSGRDPASVLDRRVQAYGGNRRVPHVRGASDVAMVAGSLTLADPVVSKK